MSVYTFRFKAAVTSGNGVLGYGSVRSSSPLHDCAHILPTCAKRIIVMNRFGQATYMYIDRNFAGLHMFTMLLHMLHLPH